MKNSVLGPVRKKLSAMLGIFEQMDVFPMRVMAGAAAAAALMLIAACALAHFTYRTGLPAASATVYKCALLADGLFDGGLRMLALGCVSAVLTDILLRSQRSIY